MLRSIFSLIQRIIDSSDKKYNNTKSKAVIYCFATPDKTVIMDLFIDGQPQKIIKTLEQKENASIHFKEKTFSLKTSQGDSVTCKHNIDINIVPKSQKDFERDESLQRVTFSNTKEETSEDEKSGVEAEDIDKVQPSVRKLIDHFPTKKITFSKESDQISSLLEQIQKMKTGLQRLQEIALQFHSSERFTGDVNFLMNNIGPYFQKQAGKEERKNLSQKT